MRKLSVAALAAMLTVVLSLSGARAEVKVAETYGDGPNVFVLATGSPGELGLLKVLGEAFAKKEKATLKWVKAGSGESLDMLKKGEVDMIMVHAPAAEKKAVAEGWAAKRELIGSNEFFIVGPAADPAGIAAAKTAVEAYGRIEKAKATFFSRGDNSGTHKKEESIWKAAGIAPSGDWYVVTKDFMTATLKRANDEKGYFMTDSSTWAAEQKSVPGLTILFKGDKALINTYHTLVLVDPAKPGPAVAAKFVDFVNSKEGQDLINAFGVKEYGQALYNDAAYAKKYDD